MKSADTREGETPVAFIALGSNLGNSPQLITKAIARLQELSDAPVIKSSFWQTTPVDCPPGSPLFVNAVVAIVPRRDETPETLLTKLQALEKEFGRQQKKVMNEPRPIDLDLITFGDETRSTAVLILPHPRAHLRRFVLQPLSEIAGDLILPGRAETVSELLSRLQTDERLTRIA